MDFYSYSVPPSLLSSAVDSKGTVTSPGPLPLFFSSPRTFFSRPVGHDSSSSLSYFSNPVDCSPSFVSDDGVDDGEDGVEVVDVRDFLRDVEVEVEVVVGVVVSFLDFSVVSGEDGLDEDEVHTDAEGETTHHHRHGHRGRHRRSFGRVHTSTPIHDGLQSSDEVPRISTSHHSDPYLLHLPSTKPNNLIVTITR